MNSKKLLLISLVGLTCAGCAAGGSDKKESGATKSEKVVSKAPADKKSESVQSESKEPESKAALSESTPPSTPAASTSTKYKVGETATTKVAKITVTSAKTMDEVDESYNTADMLDEGEKYELIEVTIENTSNQELQFSSMMNFELKNASGRAQDYEIPHGYEGQLDEKIAPGSSVSGPLVYTVDAQGELVLSFTTKEGESETVQFQIR